MHWLWLKEWFLNYYYKNEARELKSIVNEIFVKKYGGTSGKDMPEFYSVANEAFTDIINPSANCSQHGYDGTKGDFGGFLYRTVELAIIDEWKKQRRDKRVYKIEIVEDGKRKKVPVENISIFEPTTKDESLTVGDMISDEKFVEDEFTNEEDAYSDKMLRYLSRLSKMQRKVLQCTADGYTANEIQKRLHITSKEYANCQAAIHAFRNIEVLL